MGEADLTSRRYTPSMLRVLTLSTLFPDATRPNFGVFVERQTLGLAALPDTEVTVVAPVGLPPWFIRRPEHRALATIPTEEGWKGLAVHRPRFSSIPGTSGRFHVKELNRTLVPLVDRLAGTFDVIDASFFFPDGPAAVALGRRYGVPVSIKARGADVHYWGNLPATAAQVRAAGRAADGLLAVSVAMKADMVALGMPAQNIRVHYTGIDHDRFKSHGSRMLAQRDWSLNGPAVLSLGALIPRKGHDILIQAMARIPDVPLVIAGDGPERAALIALADRVGLGSRLYLLGSVPHDQLPWLLEAVNVMALASASEGLANAWVESLAMGVPIVIPDAGAAREVVTSSVAGRVVERTPEAFADAIAELLATPPWFRDVAKAAAPFSWDRNARELREHLAGLVAART